MKITVEKSVAAPLEKVWSAYTTPADIKQWNAASDDWHTTSAEVDLKVGGSFKSRMEAKDGSFGFDFGGTYNEVTPNQTIAYTMDDDRKVKVSFVENGDQTKVVETFEAENQNPVEMQKNGWQAILNNFKKYVESHA